MDYIGWIYLCDLFVFKYTGIPVAIIIASAMKLCMSDFIRMKLQNNVARIVMDAWTIPLILLLYANFMYARIATVYRVMYTMTDISRNLTTLSPNSGVFWRNKMIIVPIALIQRLHDGDPNLFVLLNISGNIFSFAADREIWPLKKTQAFNEPAHMRNVMSPINFSNDAWFPKSTVMILAKGAPTFSSSDGEMTPNIENVLMRHIKATNDVPRIIARGIVRRGFLTHPEGDVPPSNPTNPQNDNKVAFDMDSMDDILPSGNGANIFSILIYFIEIIGIIMRGNIFKILRVISKYPDVLTPRVFINVNDKTNRISQINFMEVSISPTKDMR